MASPQVCIISHAWLATDDLPRAPRKPIFLPRRARSATGLFPGGRSGSGFGTRSSTARSGAGARGEQRLIRFIDYSCRQKTVVSLINKKILREYIVKQ